MSDIRTFRAATVQEALAMVRRELGPQAAVLHTREVPGSRLWRWIPGLRRIEVTASAHVNVPSRLPARETAGALPPSPLAAPAAVVPSPAIASDRSRLAPRDDVRTQISDLQAMLADLKRQVQTSGRPSAPQELFQLFTDLIEAEVPEDLARGLIERVRSEAPGEELGDPVLVKARLLRMVEAEIRVSGPIRVVPGQAHLVALVGPTGVGKTTTIAKLAANYRLREKRKVGLITVDTYRIAAVEQLRTYADIIDLPMLVVSSPREMREAVARLADQELILMDTAGRSPRDEVKIHELKAFLTEARANEVHLVLSSVAGASHLERTAEQFSVVGATSLILTKLDEATGLGNLLPLLQHGKLPLSYVTNGQNVPDDIEAADPRRLARYVLGLEL
jgi:flagellar biosynthesis protein FlhF